MNLILFIWKELKLAVLILPTIGVLRSTGTAMLGPNVSAMAFSKTKIRASGKGFVLFGLFSY